MMEVPDHVYVLGDTYTCHTYCCYAYYFFTRIGCTLLTCDMYMCHLRHIHDPVLLSLKMDGIRLLFNMHLYDFFYVLYINCSSSGGISDTCSTGCENWTSKINMQKTAERSQMGQQCNNARYTQFPLPLPRNARTYEWVWQKRVTSELLCGTRPWGMYAS
jgi:hypothetical protein